MFFLYAPMLVLVIYSFNESKLVTVWGGFSPKWYGELFRDQQILDAVWTSLKVAFFASTMAVVLGTMAAFVMTRFKRSWGKITLSNMITAPLVMPEVITGLSLLLLFIHMADLFGWPKERGLMTVWIAPSTFCASYVAVVVSARPLLRLSRGVIRLFIRRKVRSKPSLSSLRVMPISADSSQNYRPSLCPVALRSSPLSH
ncbi:polyamine ABC transporter, permease protein [Shewanella benthica KT99]|uniref:Polyamine ABC transporter, permease protein n=1 Tax=Shewanella benthica KT99 TaxID=314608 RepID=A9EIT0_9GAMM|nr:polyamine ABC transporter, permease protein [Shewanella benthica KT99]